MPTISIVPKPESYLLLQNGDYLLLQTGDKLIIDTDTGDNWSIVAKAT